MIRFSRKLPHYFNQPIPQMMATLSQPNATLDLSLPDETTIRQMADAVAAWHLKSPLGICLRRSLLRYHFLLQAGVPVQIIFGARLSGKQDDREIGGHAWLTLNGAPYFEDPADVEGFVEMYVHPAAG